MNILRLFAFASIIPLGVIFIIGSASNNEKIQNLALEDANFENCVVQSFYTSHATVSLNCSSARGKGDKYSSSVTLERGLVIGRVISVKLEVDLSPGESIGIPDTAYLPLHNPPTDRLPGVDRGYVSLVYQFDNGPKYNDLWEVTHDAGRSFSAKTDNPEHFSAFNEGLKNSSTLNFQVGSKRYSVNLKGGSLAIEEFKRRFTFLVKKYNE